MEEVLGVTRKLYKPSPAQPSPAQPSPAQPFLAQPSPAQPSPEALDDRDTIRVPRKDLKQAAKLLQDLSAGKRVKLPVSTSREEVPFAVPDVMAGETDCTLCHQTFKSTRSLRRHMKTHTGETGYSCQCGKVLWTRQKSLVQGLQPGLHHQAGSGASLEGKTRPSSNKRGADLCHLWQRI